jgi:cytochrome c556
MLAETLSEASSRSYSSPNHWSFRKVLLMTKHWKSMLVPVSFAFLTGFAGCAEENPSGMVPTVDTPGGPGGGPPSKIRELMTKLAKGPTSLTPTLGAAIKVDKPEWDKIQPQAKEFAQLAAELAKESPRRGSKESWESLTTSYLDDAKELEKAVEAKDKDAALAAHTALAGSCKACHDVHRGGPGGGGPGGGPGGGMAPRMSPPANAGGGGPQTKGAMGGGMMGGPQTKGAMGGGIMAPGGPGGPDGPRGGPGGRGITPAGTPKSMPPGYPTPQPEQKASEPKAAAPAPDAKPATK